jgi:polynucleotide 5'-kinase involved in rRNA processing
MVNVERNGQQQPIIVRLASAAEHWRLHFSSATAVFAKVRDAIIGPVNSGKSIFLRVFGEVILNRFFVDNQR